MKSSTLRRSNITREKIAMLSALSDYNASRGRSNGNITDKQAELDILWQNFKIAATPNNSPKSSYIFGFISGVISTIVITLLLNLVLGTSLLSEVKINTINKANNIAIIPADEHNNQETEQGVRYEEYVVKAGDSLEDISKNYYGKYDEEKLNLIKEKNNLKDVNSISIGQKLIIPVYPNKQ